MGWKERDWADDEEEHVTMLECSIVRETKLAFLVGHKGKEHWLPKSEMDDPARLDVGDRGVTICIPEWLATEKGID